jgi:uncharacterized membrane protein
MKLGRADQVAIGSIVGSGALTAAIYRRLPAWIPTHFNLHGVADGWMPRAAGAWLLPGIALVTWVVLRFGARLLRPGEKRDGASGAPALMVSALVVALLCALHCVVLYAAVARQRSVGNGFGLILGTFWIVLGLMLPRVRQNRWVGVRTPWTLGSAENWARTHRVAGYTCVFAGLLAMIAVLSGHSAAAISCIVASAIIPAIYSFIIARTSPTGR